MEVKRYRGENMQEAMFKVKADLGADAIILHTRKFKKGGFFGLFGKQMVEVIATLEEQSREQSQSAEPDQLQTELSQVKEMMGTMLSELEKSQTDAAYNNLPQHLKEAAESLVACGVKESIVADIFSTVTEEFNLQEIEEESDVNQVLSDIIKERIAPAAPIKIDGVGSKVVALVGPTGVGKTTTIAKLAANFSLIEDREVGLVTADTYRIAAVEQLKTIAQQCEVTCCARSQVAR
ncbi:MAG: flagellar biosynthesis protein FlhF, partial [Bacillota bacterium]